MAHAGKDAAALFAAARGGSREALGEVLEMCRGYLLMVAQSELAPELRAKGGPSDLVQETFLDAQRDFERFHGQTEEELIAWLRQVLLNKLANFRRHYRGTAKRKVAREVALNTGDSSKVSTPVAADTPTPSVKAEANEKAEALQRALARLPEEYRQVILLRHDEARSFEEIGQLTNKSALEMPAEGAAPSLWQRP